MSAHDHQSKDARIIRNAIELLPREDLEIIAGLVKVLERRKAAGGN